MPILKAPPIQPKNETLQLRVSQDLKFRLMCYAEFIHASASYVVSAALERLFRKDTEFQEYLATHKSPESLNHSEEEQEQQPRIEPVALPKK
jgi:predicted transcriptional regulator